MNPSESHSPSFDCPLCHHESNRLFLKHGYWIQGCPVCQHRWAEIITSPAHVNQVYNDEYFFSGGAGYPNYLAEADILRKHGQQYAQLISRYTNPGTMLDVGAAAGFILRGFIDKGWQGIGIEPNRQMAEYAQTHLGLEVEIGTLEHLQTDKKYDLINMIQVLGHFFDLQKALEVASTHTKVGGFWLIETPNLESWPAYLLGHNWHMYSPPSVLHWFSPLGLRQLAAQFGFVEVAQGKPSKWIGGAHVKSVLRYKLADFSFGKVLKPILHLIPDGVSLPYPAEDLFWVLFQKSTVQVAT